MHDVLPVDPIDTMSFRGLMGQFATGVCVVSACDPDGVPFGITVNSFVSVSLEPPLIAWSVQNSATLFELWTQASAFAVSILAEDQAEVAGRYAASGQCELQPDDFTFSPRRLPRLNGALGHLECCNWSTYPAGDHTMVFGEVIDIERTTRDRPLGFFGGEFCQIPG
ncbi:MAG: flavin reductase family protein [Pseudomonadota bacterium]